MKSYFEVIPYYEPVEVWQNDWQIGISEMTREQSGFLCGLIRDSKPKKILELGIASGGTTVNILRCLDMLGMKAEMYSVDLNEKLYYDSNKETGYYARDYIKNNNSLTKHQFFTGKYLVEVLDEIGSGIDFVILDTVHLLPGELLDFLAVFPFLISNATVVLHDVIMSHENSMDDRYCFATQVLLSSVFADEFLNNDKEYPNIAAFKINDHTKDSIINVFSALTLTWRYIPDNRERELYTNWYKRFYPEELCRIWEQAIALNKRTLGKYDVSLKEYIKSIGYSILSGYDHILLYGFGKRGRSLFRALSELNGDEIKNKIEFIVSSEQEAKEKKCLWYDNIPYSKEETIIILAVNSEEVRIKLKEQKKWHWIDVPAFVWSVIENLQD